jgi:hypothetical protein
MLMSRQRSHPFVCALRLPAPSHNGRKERLHHLVRVVEAEVCRTGGLSFLWKYPGSRREAFQVTVCVLASRHTLLGSYSVRRDMSRPHPSWGSFQVYILCRFIVSLAKAVLPI